MIAIAMAFIKTKVGTVFEPIKEYKSMRIRALCCPRSALGSFANPVETQCLGSDSPPPIGDDSVGPTYTESTTVD